MAFGIQEREKMRRRMIGRRRDFDLLLTELVMTIYSE